MAVIGGLIERLLLRRLAGQELPQVLLTLGLSPSSSPTSA